MIPAGSLDRRVLVQQKAMTQDGFGQMVESWSAWAGTSDGKVWMGTRPARVSERFAANQIVAEVDTVFTARWSPMFETVRPDTHRLVYRNRVYQIHGLAEIGRREGIQITCAARGELPVGG